MPGEEPGYEPLACEPGNVSLVAPGYAPFVPDGVLILKGSCLWSPGLCDIPVPGKESCFLPVDDPPPVP